MLYVYALEPRLLSRWSDFRLFVSQFGFDQGRLIARFPKRWKKLVYESLGGCPDVEKSKIVEALTRIDDKMIPRRPRNWDDTRDWLENAEREHDELSFRAILAGKNVRKHEAVIEGDDLDPTLDYEALDERDVRRLWRATRSRIIKRTAVEMAEAIEEFLRHASRIAFVDPHFGPENPRHRKSFEEFMARLGLRDADARPDSVSVHCAIKSTAEFFENECNARLAAMIPLDLHVMFHRWEKDDVHNRFVLTDLGGVAYLEGLDVFEGKGREDDVVVLLDRDVARQLMANYLSDGSFQLVDCCKVTGSKPR